MTEQRYLPLFQADGSWIERPDLFLLAQMGYEPEGNDNMIQQIHDTMARANNASETLNTFEQDIANRHLARKMRRRMFAGQTLLELVRIATATSKPPSAGQGIRLTAFNHQEFVKKSSIDSIERQVRKGFTEFRDTAHLQAAAVLAQPSVWDIEGSEVNTRRFLARARGLEIFMDTKIISDAFRWHPLRVPEVIEPILEIKLHPLSRKELDIIGIRGSSRVR